MSHHHELHRIGRTGWLRAAVLGANDGLISTASLIIGVAAAHPEGSAVLLAGFAGLVGGSLAMAAGEYVSVSSQADSEQADLARERQELHSAPEAEQRELAGIYVRRGLTPELADQVAQQLTAHDALGAHARDELGITDFSRAQPLLAAIASAGSFALGALLPLLVTLLVPAAQMSLVIFAVTLLLLLALGAAAAQLGGARRLPAALRVAFWGALAMAITGLAGHYAGAAI
jgi:VIT1/CCC1 family predicted Fe2+/Mn2+ transporter